MLKFTERPKILGMTSKKKTFLYLMGISCCMLFVVILIKQTLIWLNLQRDETGNELSNIRNMQKVCSCKYQFCTKVCAYSSLRSWSLKFI